MQFEIKEAKREGQWARIAIDGPSGSGKTYSALQIAKGLTRNGKILVIDTESGAAKKYAKILGDVKFSVIDLANFSPAMYTEAIKYAVSQGFDTIIIDSLSHGWSGKGGALEQVDNAAARGGGNSFTAWRTVNPQLAELTATLIGVLAHTISTMRVKTEYVTETDNRGKAVPRKVGLAPIQRDNLEYEFDVYARMDMDNNLVISKTRVDWLNGQVIHKPGEKLGRDLRDWYDGNDPIEEKLPEPVEAAVPAPAVTAIEGPTVLQRIGGLMKRKGVTLDVLEDKGFGNPRLLSAEQQAALIAWLEEK